MDVSMLSICFESGVTSKKDILTFSVISIGLIATLMVIEARRNEYPNP